MTIKKANKLQNMLKFTPWALLVCIIVNSSATDLPTPTELSTTADSLQAQGTPEKAHKTNSIFPQRIAPQIKRPAIKTSPIRNHQETQRTSKNLWTLNQQDTDLKDFIDQVASITGDTFIIDPKLRVDSKVNVVSSEPMNQEEVYNLFLEILNANDFAVIPKGKKLKTIVGHTTARVAGSHFSKEEKPLGATMVTQVVDLHSVSSVEVIPIIRPLIAQYGHAAASSTGNAVVVSDLKDNVERVVKLVRELDEASDNDYEVIKLEHAWVSDVAHVIQETLQTGRTSYPSSLQVIADERSNRLVVKGNANKRVRVRKLVQTLDQEGVRRSTTKVVFLRHADAKNIAGILTEAAQKLPSVNKNNKQITPTSSLRNIPSSPSISPPTSSSNSGKLSENIFIKADETTNALVMISEPNTLKELEDLVRQLDVRRAQVLIEAAVVEVSGDTNQSLGIQWGINGKVTQNNSVAGAFIKNEDLSIGTLALRNLNFGVLIHALTSKINSNLLSTPSLLTLDNELAELSVGQEVPFKTGSYTNDSGGSNPFTTTERKAVGLNLKVTPHIGDGAALRLEIEQEISKLLPNSSKTLGTSDVVTDRRKLKATIIVDDRQTIVLGGLLQDDTKQVQKNVPILSKIPFIGNIFKHTENQREKKNLMLFIKPSIVREAKALASITKDKFNTIRVIRSPLTDGYNHPSEFFDPPKPATKPLKQGI